MFLPGGELNAGLPRDRRGYSPLYYRGTVLIHLEKCSFVFQLSTLLCAFKIHVMCRMMNLSRKKTSSESTEEDIAADEGESSTGFRDELNERFSFLLQKQVSSSGFFRNSYRETGSSRMIIGTTGPDPHFVPLKKVVLEATLVQHVLCPWRRPSWLRTIRVNRWGKVIPVQSFP